MNPNNKPIKLKEFKLPKISIIFTFNDIEGMLGTTKGGVKSNISYFDQFLIAHRSISKNWTGKYFNYNFVIVHTLDFSPKQYDILKRLSVKTVFADYEKYKSRMRSHAYLMDLDCDYRLILDNDILALSEPKFDFKKDALAMYGGNKFNKLQWKMICEYLNCDLPKKTFLKIKSGSYNPWGFLEHFLAQTGVVRNNLFPYFNNGAILIKNSLANQLGNNWNDFRIGYSKYYLEKFNKDLDGEGQDTIGLAIHLTTHNWSLFPKGFNFVSTNFFFLARIMEKYFSNNVSMVHYIRCTKKSRYFAQIERYHEQVKRLYI